MLPALAHVDCWIFDLDNTLYPASADLFARIDVRMGQFVQNLLGVDPVEAHRIQKSYFVEHGTTLNGLMARHGIEPREFLDFVHDIEMDALAEDRRLVEALARLPGRKLVFTNGDHAYARRVLGRLGLSESFEAIHDIHACAYRPKPDPASYDAMCAALNVAPRTALFVEDMARNLKPAKALGMKTVWVNNGSDHGDHGHDPDYIDYEIAEVGEWLEEILGTKI
ncbi:MULTISPECIES: pyrimidine 5'-nucleotidase [Sphingomonadales]|uniref:Phosphoglycolate phosphatase n=1 Tax=Edaphosphingomonas haloaromaticamans TaxID=653954 RepID=A0A1S1HKV1_9SPHN|nr:MULTISPECIES: pyrimidine 5'-nucleotidase [Sphingomonas]AGH49480.1 pyrimidine 5'-nucleotidase [Sphingomonas sp. MM-1]MDX3886083.1 pyrimidine 5'-nucleotidase [Sphingomonas sp.]OHT22071.1 Phosphoglycolate phosphatase [Sphingomonas haloaromaticamans]